MIQGNLFSEIYEEKRIEKPIRLIELFAGIGAQHKALSMLGVPFESWKICEWAYNSIIAYNAIHIKDFKDYSDGKTKEELIAYLNGNISIDYNKPCDCTKRPLEWLKNAYNNCIATNNMMNIMKVKGSDLEIVDTDKYEYVMTYSFPCQDLSLAGKRQGMSVSQAEGGTRSGLLWEVERILTELNGGGQQLPQILIMENVPQVIGSGNIKDFQKWEYKLSELGYQNYIEVLNAKDFEIPQNRQRCFMVSILGEYLYEFPTKKKLKIRLKDLLEDEVDEKYYLSQKMVDFFVENTKKQSEKGNGFKFLPQKEREAEIARSITTRSGNRMDDNFIETEKVKRIGGLYDKEGQTHQAGSIYDKEGLSPTLDCSSGGGNRQPFIIIPEATKKGYAEAEEGDGVYINRPHQKRGVVQKGIIQTIKTSCDDLGVVVKNDKSLWSETQTKMITKDGNVKRYINSDVVDEFKEGWAADISFPNGFGKGKRTYDVCPTLTIASVTPIVKVRDKKGNEFPLYKDTKQLRETIENNEFETGEPLNLDLYNRTTYEESQTLTSPTHNSQRLFDGLRIRKLTPKECCRLMGFEDKDYVAMKQSGLSDSAIYHCCGDSIVTTVLKNIFEKLTK